MNSLSWLLYLADLSGKLGAITGISLFIFLILNVILGIRCIEGGIEAIDPTITKAYKALAGFCVAFSVLAILVPSKTTIYLIAASEAGEEVLKTEQARQVGEYLDQLLDDLVED